MLTVLSGASRGLRAPSCEGSSWDSALWEAQSKDSGSQSWRLTSTEPRGHSMARQVGSSWHSARTQQRPLKASPLFAECPYFVTSCGVPASHCVSWGPDGGICQGQRREGSQHGPARRAFCPCPPPDLG